MDFFGLSLFFDRLKVFFLIMASSSGPICYSLYILNKTGGLIYNADFSKDSPKNTTNDHLRLGGSFYSMHAISSKLSPTGKASGIQTLETPTFKLRCFQTTTGVKFYMTAPPKQTQQEMKKMLLRVYASYTDYVMKNPFYEPEQPIRCEKFHIELESYLNCGQ